MEFKRDAKRARRRAPPRRVRARALLSRNEFATWDRQTLRILAQGHHHKRGSVGCCGPSQNKNFVPYLLHPCALSAAAEHRATWRLMPSCVMQHCSATQVAISCIEYAALENDVVTKQQMQLADTAKAKARHLAGCASALLTLLVSGGHCQLLLAQQRDFTETVLRNATGFSFTFCIIICPISSFTTWTCTGSSLDHPHAGNPRRRSCARRSCVGASCCRWMRHSGAVFSSFNYNDVL